LDKELGFCLFCGSAHATIVSLITESYETMYSWFGCNVRRGARRRRRVWPASETTQLHAVARRGRSTRSARLAVPGLFDHGCQIGLFVKAVLAPG